MHTIRKPMLVCSLIAGLSLSLAGCGSGGSGSDPSGQTYTSVNNDGLSFAFGSGGAVTMTAKAMNVSSTGKYTVDGDKFIVTIDGQTHTFIRDGKCIEEGRQIFGRLCVGGKAGADSNVSTRKPPATDGVWTAKNADGDFTIEFKAGNRLTLTGTMAGGGRTSTEDGTFVIEGDRVNVRFPTGMPFILQFVNDTYETTSFGLPMTFRKQ